jgi:hypothetical protein
MLGERISSKATVIEVKSIEELVSRLPKSLIDVLASIPDSVLEYDATSEDDDYFVRTQKQKSLSESAPDQESGT